MAATDSLAVRVINDVVHDVAAAVAIAAPYSTLALRALAGTKIASDPALAGVAWRLLTFGVLALFVLVFTGAVRLRYAQSAIEPAARDARIRGAVIKHGVFGLLFVGGIALAAMTASGLAA